MDVSGRLYDRLEGLDRRLKPFKDVDDIPAGVDFRAHLDGLLKPGTVVLVVIGPSWLKVQDSHGRARLFQSQDYVRMEVRLALERGLHVIPVLVGATPAPSSEDLPPDLAGLARLEPSRLRPDPDFARDCGRLVTRLQGLPDYRRPSESGRVPYLLVLAGVAAFAVLGAAALMLFAV